MTKKYPSDKLGRVAEICLDFAEIILAYAAEGADEIVGKILELGAGSDAVIGIADSLVVLIAADITYIFFHKFILL